MLPADVTPLILTFNEAPNLRRTLERLAWAKEIVVVDSFSNDETLEIARSFPQVRVVQRVFDTHAQQWNFGLQQVRTPWVLSLDADYVLPESFAGELNSWPESDATNAYFARFRYCIHGHPLRSTLYPPRLVLFQRAAAIYFQDGHTQQLRVTGTTGFLSSVIDHDDRKPLAHWLRAQDKYAVLEVQKLLSARPGSLRAQDRLRLWMLPAPFVVFLYTLLWKRALFDGWPGWLYVFQRVTAELILSMHLLETRLAPRKLKS